MAHAQTRPSILVLRIAHDAWMHVSRVTRCIPLFACALMMHANAAASPPEATPFLIRPESLLNDFDALGVTVAPDVLRDSLHAYLAAYELTLIDAVEDGARITPKQATHEETIMGLRDAKKFAQFSMRLADACAQMRVDLFARLAAAVPSEMRASLQACGELTALREAQHFWREAVRSSRVHTPDDVSDWLRFRRDGMDATSEERKRLTQLCAIHATQRAAAMRAAWTTLRGENEAIATRADELGATGKTFAQLQGERMRLFAALYKQSPTGGIRPDQFPPDVAHELRSNSGTFEVGGDAFTKLVEAQLQTYRVMDPQLTAEDRKALRLYWMPRLLGLDQSIAGMPRFSLAGSDPASLAREFIRTANITEPTRERVRTLCRAWLKADAQLLDRAFADLVARRTVDDASERRVELAATVRLELSQLKGFDWLSSDDYAIKIPEVVSESMSDADLAEFGTPSDHIRAEARLAGDEAALDAAGIPRLYSAAESDHVATQLRLDAGQREIFVALLADARAAWEVSVAPTAREGITNDGPRNAVMNGEQLTEYYAREKVTTETRARAWKLARAADDEFFRNLAAAMGERCDRPALECARAARLARNMMASAADFNQWGEAPFRLVDIANAALETPLTDEVRAAALASANSSLPAWIATVDDASLALRAVQTASEEFFASNLDQSENAAQHRAQAQIAHDAANARVEPALRACVESGDAYCNAFATALPPHEAQRWSDLLLNLRSPYRYSDARPLWRAIDASIACVPEAERESVRAQADACEATLAQLNQRMLAHSAQCTGQNAASSAFGTLCGAQLRWMAVATEYAFPPQCREGFEFREWLMLRKLFGRVTQSTTTEDAATVGK